MRPSMYCPRIARFLLSLFAAVALPQAARAQDVLGEWEMKMDFNGRETYGSLTISKGADGSLAGKWGREDLSAVKFEGGKLSFVRTIRMGDQEFKTGFEGVLKDGGLSGTLTSDRGDRPVTGARRKPQCPAVGRWELKYTIREREMTAVLALSAKDGVLEGKWTAAQGEHTVSDVKYDGGKLAFHRKS
jgi:hypothetical protein